MRTAAFVLVAFLALAACASAAPPTPAEDLATGIRQIEEGDFETGVLTLDAVVGRLTSQGGRAADLARAYTYLAIGYLGLSQEQTAKAKFVDALRQDGSLSLSPKDYPPRVIKAFEEAKKQTRPEPTPTPRATAAAPATSTAAARPAQQSGGSTKKWLLLGAGGVAAAGGAVLVLGGSECDNVDKPFNITVGPGNAPDINWSPPCAVSYVSAHTWAIESDTDSIKPPVAYGSQFADTHLLGPPSNLPSVFLVFIRSTNGKEGRVNATR